MNGNGLTPDLLIIRGQNHYRGNIVSLFDQFAQGFSQELTIDGLLEPEPTNVHDPNAVVLKVRGYIVGYISVECAGRVKAVIGSGAKIECKMIWNRDPVHPAVSVVVTNW